MGRALVISGVSFMVNGILNPNIGFLLNFDSYSAESNNVFTSNFVNNTIFYINGNYGGRDINGIALKVQSDAKIKLYKAVVDGMYFSDSSEIKDMLLAGTKSFKKYDFDSSIHLEKNELLGIALISGSINIVSGNNNGNGTYGTPQVLMNAGTPSSPNESGTFQLNNAVFCNLY